MNDGAPASEHAVGRLRLPDGVDVIEGSPNGARRAVGIVVSRFNGDITSKLLDGAIEALEDAGVERDRIDIVPVPGAFELPLGAMALARTRQYACVVAIGCVIRGGTPHFDFVAGEAASGLQLAALETGIPVSFGVLRLKIKVLPAVFDRWLGSGDVPCLHRKKIYLCFFSDSIFDKRDKLFKFNRLVIS